MPTKSSDKSDTNKRGQANQQGSSERGFASMDPKRQREIASEGGQAAHQSGRAHEFTSEEAREAGKKSHGGQASASKRQGSSSTQNRTEGRTEESSSFMDIFSSGNTRGGNTRATPGKRSEKPKS